VAQDQAVLDDDREQRRIDPFERRQTRLKRLLSVEVARAVIEMASRWRMRQ
jgi:hypothetical protein